MIAPPDDVERHNQMGTRTKKFLWEVFLPPRCPPDRCHAELRKQGLTSLTDINADKYHDRPGPRRSI